MRLELAVPGFRRLELHPRSLGAGRVFDGIESKLTANRVVELESEELSRAYKLEVDDACDEVTVRRLFTPEAITRILDSFPRGAALELEGSTLVFFEKGSITPKRIGTVEALVADATPFVAWLAAS